MGSSCVQSAVLTFDQRSQFTGCHDSLAVEGFDGTLTCSGILVTFDRLASNQVEVWVNGQKKTVVPIENDGVLFMKKPTSQFLKKLQLKQGRNDIQYKSQSCTMSNQIYLIPEKKKIVISDIDGTLTESDVAGGASMFGNWDHTHPNYRQLVQAITANGYMMVWLTMKPHSFYPTLRQYIDRYIGVPGPILTSRQSVSQAFKDEVTGATSSFKCTIMQELKECFPKMHPFAGGLGNRKGDLIAYLYAKMPDRSILIVNTSGVVFNAEGAKDLSYQKVLQSIEHYFPKNGLGVPGKIS